MSHEMNLLDQICGSVTPLAVFLPVFLALKSRYHGISIDKPAEPEQ